MLSASNCALQAPNEASYSLKSQNGLDFKMFSFFQEKSIALKIFELGLKRYNDVPEYALCYIEFMSHLNGEFTPSPQKNSFSLRLH